MASRQVRELIQAMVGVDPTAQMVQARPAGCGWGRTDLHARREVRRWRTPGARVHAKNCAIPSRLPV